MPLRSLLFHKPFRVLSQFTAGSTPAAAEPERLTLANFIPVAGVYPVGRLDFDSEGLMLLTNDGAMQHLLSDPRHAHPRTYWVQVEGAATPDAIDQLARGVTLADYRTRPAEARLIEPPGIDARVPPIRERKAIPTSWIELTLREGRNRQVRRMTAAVGFPTLRLIRVRIGDLSLDGLAPGQWRDLSRSELSRLRSTRRAQ